MLYAIDTPNGFREDVQLTLKQKSIMELNSWFSDLNESNLKHIAKYIISSTFAKTQESLPILCKTLLNTIQLRFLELPLYVELISKILAGESKRNAIGALPAEIIKVCFEFTPEYNPDVVITKFHFLRMLLNAKLVKIQSITASMKEIDASRPNFLFLAALFFLPEITSTDQRFTKKLNEMIPDLRLTERCLHPYQDRFSELSENDFSKLKELTEIGVEKTHIAYSIMKDDVNSFERHVNQEKIDLEGFVDDILFIPCQFLKMTPSYIDFPAFFGSTKIVDWILSHKIQFSSPMMFAVAGGNMKSIQYFLSRGYDFEKCLRVATYFKRIDLFNYIRPKIAQAFYNSELNICLCRASEQNEIRVVKFCIDSKCNVNCTDEKGESPVFLASRAGNNQLLKILLDVPGCSKKIPNMFGNRADEVAEDATLQTLQDFDE
ncbi:hypothetical protein TVAG_396290 [Trichomonas vaginalis G3]|uniref:Uncharacterized protein n=1 Tax=Trichomonas vaginalis (strain ATCC PRA-98 / G3) TaxID=412133 RepID=A2ESD9_TRIV3|nr:spectrin binding [Trichomonas vaginalis G3]EAY04442.1 hypothetical protein TVAG_396290 [Trichomonas vaginalis G3]KAI5502196.1 spectrin binding [Trichomonas vaginalis G3]|eukprot:XP_001316665.1 hypothetical protein [Trichomonas vaginalis G3]